MSIVQILASLGMLSISLTVTWSAVCSMVSALALLQPPSLPVTTSEALSPTVQASAGAPLGSLDSICALSTGFAPAGGAFIACPDGGADGWVVVGRVALL